MSTCCLPSSNIFVEKTGEPTGRVLRTNAPILAGGIVVENFPTAHVLLTNLWGERCLNCFRRRVKLSLCMKCRKASYCSRQCQAGDWSQHKIECKHINKIWGKLSTQILDEVFILLRLSAIENVLDDSCKLVMPHAVLCGKRHTESLHLGTPVQNITDDFSKIVIHLASEISKKSIEEICRMLRQFRSNNFGVTDELVNCIGIGVYPAAALLNHSCAPNCILRYKLCETGPAVQVVVVRDINAGEELTHSYIDCSLPRVMRQDRLLDIYGFSCSCPLCTIIDDDYSASIRNFVEGYLLVDPHIQNPFKLKEKLTDFKAINGLVGSSCLNVENFISQTLLEEIPWKQDIMEKVLAQIDVDMLHAEDDPSLLSCLSRMKLIEEKFATYYGPFHIENHKLRGKLLTAYLLIGDHEGAYRTCSQIVSYLTLSLGNMDKHPLLGVQLFTLGDISAMCNRVDLAMLHYEWCRDIMRVSHIPDEELSKKLTENITQLQRSILKT